MADPFRIGIAGLGTVGAGVVKILQQNADLISARAGRRVEIVSVSARDKKRDRGVDLKSYAWAEKPEALLKNVDAIVEVIGGAEGDARAFVTAALEKGIHVVTANKALIATHGFELAALAEKNKASLRYEASVAGCVPIIKALREGFAANNISAIYGILNGTCNYILTQMRETGRGFVDVLKEAQTKGYAEADPSFDVDGIDAGHKLAILASLAFGTKPDFNSVDINGIRQLSAHDIEAASGLGYKIKLLGIAKSNEGKIVQSVEPCLVPERSQIGMIEDVYNAVVIKGEFIGQPMLTGRGAGEGPTASAIVADLIDLVRGVNVPTFGVPANKLKEPQSIDRGKTESRYYVRLNVLDIPGVIAEIGAILRDHKISVESLVQRGRDPEQPVSLVIITHEARHKDMLEAVKLIGKLGFTKEKPCLMRIEEL
jgi:homoserine dehydrogenase